MNSSGKGRLRVDSPHSPLLHSPIDSLRWEIYGVDPGTASLYYSVIVVCGGVTNLDPGHRFPSSDVLLVLGADAMVNAEGKNQHGGKLGKRTVLDDRSQRTWLIGCGH